MRRSRVRDVDILRELEATIPGFSRAAVAKRILDQGAGLAIKAGCSSVTVDGLTFPISPDGRVTTSITGKNKSHRGRKAWG